MVDACKYCHKENKLIKAHIIPKKFYLGIKEDKCLCINSKTEKYIIQQQGGYDSNILCGDCDNHILGEFDKEGYRILTAKECWRLMGFDDEDYEKAAKVCQKSQLYKQAGNSIVVNVLEALIADIYGVKLDKHYKLQQKKLF